MKKLKLILTFLFLLIAISACQTFKEKTDAIIEKENQELSKLIGKSSNDLQVELGKPDEDFKNESGNLVFVYNSRKYGILCERRFEMNSNLKIVGFVSNGCF